MDTQPIDPAHKTYETKDQAQDPSTQPIDPEHKTQHQAHNPHTTAHATMPCINHVLHKLAMIY